MQRPYIYFILAFVAGGVWGALSVTSVQSILVRVTIGVVLGTAIGVMAFSTKENRLTAYLVASASSICIVVAFAIFTIASPTATAGTLVTAIIVACLIFWALTRNSQAK